MTAIEAASANASMQKPVLVVKNLSAGYGELRAVRDVSFQVHPGEIVAMFGANGAGKTTTLLATVGELPRAKGEVIYRDAPATGRLHKLARSGLAFVPEAPSVISGLSAHDNLRIGRGSVELALEYFPELVPLLNRRAGLLSGGEQQILALARALAGQPDVLLVDEFSLGLAPLIVDRLMSALRTIADSTGVGVVLVEQQARRALAVADTWYLLRSGTVVDHGDASATANLDAAYLGSMTEAEQPASAS
jgi:branched-chain amino acid transport system ATP-binding protein